MATTVIFTNHTADHVPGEVVTLDTGEAERLFQAAMARAATEDEVAAAEAAARQAEQATVEAQNDEDAKSAKAAAKK